MTVQTQAQAFAAGKHVVHFYEHDSELCSTAGNYLADAIHGGGVAIIIATDAHRRALAAEAWQGLEVTLLDHSPSPGGGSSSVKATLP